jgi:hypothetical protein
MDRFWDSKVVKNKNTLINLKNINIQKNGLYIPAIWPKTQVNFSRVCWRFCGGFFIGDIESILKFNSLYDKYFINIVNKYNVLPWEVSIWAYFELADYFSPYVYYADHNDSMLNVNLDPCGF